MEMSQTSSLLYFNHRMILRTSLSLEVVLWCLRSESDDFACFCEGEIAIPFVGNS